MENKKTILQLPATIESINSRADGTWTLKLGTQEINEEQSKAVIKLNRKLGWFIFKENPLKESDLVDIPEIEPEFKTDKSPSQRLRGVLYVLWEKKYKAKGDDFDDFYKKQMEKIITWAKEKID